MLEMYSLYLGRERKMESLSLKHHNKYFRKNRGGKFHFASINCRPLI